MTNHELARAAAENTIDRIIAFDAIRDLDTPGKREAAVKIVCKGIADIYAPEMAEIESTLAIVKRLGESNIALSDRLTAARRERVELLAELECRQWIKCIERMPEMDVDVLIVFNGRVTAGYLSPFYCRGDVFKFRTVSGSIVDSSDVTRWQPLPETPEATT